MIAAKPDSRWGLEGFRVCFRVQGPEELCQHADVWLKTGRSQLEGLSSPELSSHLAGDSCESPSLKLQNPHLYNYPRLLGSDHHTFLLFLERLALLVTPNGSVPDPITRVFSTSRGKVL